MQRPQRLPSNTAKSYDLGFKSGAVHGFDEARMGVLTLLQDKYIKDPDRPDRGSPKAEAILELAKELDTFLTDLKLKKIS